MHDRTVIIIGGGVAGLAAGCYAQASGYRSLIMEQHILPGGLCTSWERRGYTFDGCISYLYGSGTGQPFSDLWTDLGVAGTVDMIQLDEFIRVRGPARAGTTEQSSTAPEIVAWADPERLERHLLEAAPEDRRLIRALAAGIRQVAELDLSVMQRKPRALMTPLDWGALGVAMTPYVPATMRWMNVSAEDLARRARNPLLRRALPFLLGWPEIPVLAGLTMLASMHAGNAGFPRGGSLGVARALERRYLELGGEIRYGSRVERIVVQNDRAVAVRLYTDEEFSADHIISAADLRGTLAAMLRGEYTTRAHRRLFDGRHPIHSQIQVSIGVARDLSAEAPWAIHLLDRPVTIAAEERTELSIRNFAFDPSLMPAGKGVVELYLRINYEYWQHIYGNRLYRSEQTQVEEQVTEQLERIWPGIADDVEVIDVATPLSYERYTTTWQGSSCGWLLTPAMMRRMIVGMPKRVPRLAGLTLAGQWVEPGGSVPLSAASGRQAVQLICHEDGRPFRRPTA